MLKTCILGGFGNAGPIGQYVRLRSQVACEMEWTDDDGVFLIVNVYGRSYFDADGKFVVTGSLSHRLTTSATGYLVFNSATNKVTTLFLLINNSSMCRQDSSLLLFWQWYWVDNDYII